MRLQIWDKAPLLHNTQAFIEHLGRLEAQGCRWLFVPLTADESFGSFKCSKCSSDYRPGRFIFDLDAHSLRRRGTASD